jgi:hypothetical protein
MPRSASLHSHTASSLSVLGRPGTFLTSRAHPFRYQLVNSSGILQIATGALPPGGTAFATHYKHF